MGEVTILHTRGSREFACEMAAALAAEGHSIFRRDADAPAADAPYADAVIVIWSSDAISSPSTVDAARKALARRILVPVAIGDVSPPSSFAHLWPIDLADWSGDRDDPRWQFVRDEISLAMRRNEFARPNQIEDRSAASRRLLPKVPARAVLPGLLGTGVLAAAIAAVALFVAPASQPALRGDEPARAKTASLTGPSQRQERPIYSRARATADENPSDRNAESIEQDAGTGSNVSAASDAGGARDSLTPEKPAALAVVTADKTSLQESAPAAATKTAEVREDDSAAPSQASEGDRANGANDAASAKIALPAGGDEAQGADESASAGATAQEEAPAPLPPRSADDFKGAVFRDCVDCPDLAEIEPGATIPAKGVETVSTLTFAAPFAMSRREITFAEWDACVRGGGCRAYSPPDAGWGRGKRPVVNVSYQDAQNYVDWLSKQTGRRYRLPTAAEWIYAAHAGVAGNYSFGAPSARKANYDGGPGARRRMTEPVGSFAPSAYGLYDMNGNVAEWVDGCADKGAASDEACSARIAMGGAWDSPASAITADSREMRPGTTRAPDIGFRVARDAP